MKKKNDDNIFDEVMHKYYQSIFNYCFVQLLNDKVAAEDCTQEVFMILYQKMDSLSDLVKIRPWLYKTAIFVIKNYNRVNNKRVTENIDDYENILVSQDGFDTQIEDMEIMQMLSEEEKIFVKNYYINKIPIHQLAKSLNISEAALYKRASRIKLKIAKMINYDDKNIKKTLFK